MPADILQILEYVFILAMAVILHECAHGWVALKCGDSTAKMMGRLTLNPLKHVDFFGTIMIPVITKLTLGFPFGWAKPVPVNFHALNNPKTDMILVAIAGPVTNIIIAMVASLLLPFDRGFFSMMIIVNVMLAVFNMTPLPPLDGSRVVAGLLPNDLARKYLSIEPYGFIIMIVLLQLKALDFLLPIVIGISMLLGVRVS